MPPRLRPVEHEARLTIVEHLGELRTRLLISIAMIAVAFAFTYWQHNRILDVVTRPLTQSAQPSKDNSRSGDPIAQGQRFDAALSQALKALAPAVDGLARTANAISIDQPAAQRRAAQQQIRQARQAAAALRRAAALAPKSTGRRPVTLGVTEPFFQTLSVAGYAALVIVMPLLLYQLYAFLIPAFTERERRVIVPMLLMVPFLFYAGVAFGYFLALPRAVDFLQNFNKQDFDVLVQAKDYFKFVALFLLGTGVVFQIPVVVLTLSRLNIVTARQLRKRRGFVLLGAAVVAAVITPTPDPFTMLLVMTPLYLLFEGSVFVAGILERRRPEGSGWWGRDDDDDGDDEEPDAGVGPRGGGGAGARSHGGEHPDDETWDWDDDEGTYEHEIAGPLAPVGGREGADAEAPGDRVGSRLPRLASRPEPSRPDEVAGPGPATGAPDEDPWWLEADELDAEDPYVGGKPQDDAAGRADEPEAGPGGPGPDAAPDGTPASDAGDGEDPADGDDPAR